MLKQTYSLKGLLVFHSNADMCGAGTFPFPFDPKHAPLFPEGILPRAKSISPYPRVIERLALRGNSGILL